MDTKAQIAIVERHIKVADEHVQHAASIGDEAAHLTIACQSYSTAINALLNIVKSQERALTAIYQDRE